MKHLTAFLCAILFLGAAAANAKTLFENCTNDKLKVYKTKNLVTIAEEAALLRRFRVECAKTTFTTPAEKQALAAEAQAAERQAQAEKETKAKEAKLAKEAKEKAVVKPPAPAPVAATPVASTAAPIGAQAVIGGCGTPEQCAAYMKEANTPKYTWSSPGLQVYLGELWGNSFSYASGLGGTFEQPENACNDSNQGQMIGLDLGTEVIGVACMSSKATQEEIKKMAEKIKNTKVETLVPTVIAVKKPKYEWKVTIKPVPLEGQICFCKHPGGCSADNLGQEYSEHTCCGTAKCIRLDGGPVKPKSGKSKPVTAVKSAVEPATPAPATSPPAAPPPPMGYDAERDGAAGP